MKFNGEAPQEYRRWKMRLQNEVKGLQPSSSQWLELLGARTISLALEVVKEVDVLREELGNEYTLEAIWRSLDKRFVSKQNLLQELLHELQSGPLVDSNDLQTLWKFVRACRNAIDLMNRKNTLLNIPNQEAIQQMVTGRLQGSLRAQWMDEKEDSSKSGQDLPFTHFTDWIERRAKDKTS